MGTKFKERTIDLHKIKEGVHTLTARVKEIKPGIEWFGCGVEGKAYDYVYFEEISILIKGNWYSIKCSGNSFRAKLIGELANLNLKKNDFIRFDAEVIFDLIEFLYREGKDEKLMHFMEETGEISAIAHDEPYAILPKSYTGNIAIGICEALFYDSEYADRCYHILKQMPRYKFDLEYSKIAQLLAISAAKDEPNKRIAMFYYNPLFTRFFNCRKLTVQSEQKRGEYD